MESLSPSAPGHSASPSPAEGTGTGCKEHAMGSLGSANPAGQSFVAAVLLWERCPKGNLSSCQHQTLWDRDTLLLGGSGGTVLPCLCLSSLLAGG